MIVVQCYLDDKRNRTNLEIIGCIDDSVDADDMDLIRNALWDSPEIKRNTNYHAYLRRARCAETWVKFLIVVLSVELIRDIERLHEPLLEVLTVPGADPIIKPLIP